MKAAASPLWCQPPPAAWLFGWLTGWLGARTWRLALAQFVDYLMAKVARTRLGARPAVLANIACDC